MAETGSTGSSQQGLGFPGGEVVVQPEPALLIVPSSNNQQESTASDGQHWRIGLSPAGNADCSLALELHGDIVIGAGKEDGAEVDVNLEEWQGSSRGVSIRHVMLRPTQSKVFIMDLRSGTGTSINGLPLGVGWAYALQHNDLITLGHLNVRYRVLQTP
jgi:hypothetical protein